MERRYDNRPERQFELDYSELCALLGLKELDYILDSIRSCASLVEKTDQIVVHLSFEQRNAQNQSLVVDVDELGRAHLEHMVGKRVEDGGRPTEITLYVFSIFHVLTNVLLRKWVQ